MFTCNIFSLIVICLLNLPVDSSFWFCKQFFFFVVSSNLWTLFSLHLEFKSNLGKFALYIVLSVYICMASLLSISHLKSLIHLKFMFVTWDMNLNFSFFKIKKMLSFSSNIKIFFYPSDMGCFLFHLLYVSVVFIYRMSCILGSIFIFLFFSTSLSLHMSLPHKYNHRVFIVFFNMW